MVKLKSIIKEFISKPTNGVWNGRLVEFGKVYGNPMVNAFKSIKEVDSSNKKLRIFDFDDTLVKTKSHIYVRHGDGSKSKMTPGEYAVYDPKSDDIFDFSEFQQVTQPQEIRGITDLLKTIVKAEGERKIVILTARSAYKPIKDYLNDIGLSGIYVVALGDSNPQKKADWIEDKIKQGYNDVFFIDDSHKNVDAVLSLKKKYPKIKLKVRTVNHDKPAMPKLTDSNNINELASLLPKKWFYKK